MAFGSNYVANPELYSEVAAYAAGTGTTIPSGASIVQGIYYMWDSQGFSGKGWLYKVEGGPTNKYPDFKSDEDVEAFLRSKGNLDDVFEYWSQNYDLTGWDNFYNAVGTNSGCMDVVRPQ